MKLNLKQSWIIALVEHVPRFQEKVSLHYIAQSSRVIEEIKKKDVMNHVAWYLIATE